MPAEETAVPTDPAPAPAAPINPADGAAGAEYVLKGKIALHREKKGRAGKTATRISGLNLTPDALAAVARDMKRQLGCAAVVEQGDVVLLGDLSERAADWLRAHGAKRVVV